MCVLPFMIINLLNTIIILAKRGWTNYALETKLSKKCDVVMLFSDQRTNTRSVVNYYWLGSRCRLIKNKPCASKV